MGNNDSKELLVLGRRDLLGAVGTILGNLARPFGNLAAQGTPATVPTYLVPKLSKPLPDSVAKGLTIWDPAPIEYLVEEYFMSGTAPVYAAVSMADVNVPQPMGVPPIADPFNAQDNPERDKVRIPTPFPGDYSARPILRTAPYRTRIVVYRPRDLQRFSGNLIVEAIHPRQGGYVEMWSMLNKFYASRGDISVHVQHPVSFDWIRYNHKDRYGSLISDDNSQIWGMLSDAARLLKDGGATSPVRAKARHAYLTGYSMTAGVVTTYLQRQHNVNRMPGGAPLYDGYLLGTGGGAVPPLDVPIMAGANQLSNFPDEGVALRRAFDSDDLRSHRRRYEIAGFPHAPLPYPGEPGAAIAAPEKLSSWQRCGAQAPEGAGPNPNTFGRAVYEAMFRNMSDWVERGIAPPKAPIIESDSGKPKLGPDGNVIGGLRMPGIAVPLGSYGVFTGGCSQIGWIVKYPPARCRELYGSKAKYLELYGSTADKLVADRFLLRERAEQMKASAAAETPDF